MIINTIKTVLGIAALVMIGSTENIDLEPMTKGCDNHIKRHTYEVPEYVPQQSSGDHLTKQGGVYWFGDQKETYYNLNMIRVIDNAHNAGIEGEYWVREDGCKMLGDYIMIAAAYWVHPYGSLVNTSLGVGIVVDTGAFASSNELQVDIAVTW